MQIEIVTSDSKLLELLDKYLVLPTQSETVVSDIINKLGQNITNPELIIPVLGSQGTGKSTLINAILGVNVLPNDADETTCVPIEVRYGKEEKAVVHFQSGNFAEIKFSCDSLKEFADNNENTENKRCISHIVLEIPNKLLQNGLVIVDLPGIGSLTQTNQETTMRYIRQLGTAIFVIPTVPTIRRSEEIFIRGTWSGFSSATFVQNRWDDETDQEVTESVAFNTLVLKNIAKKGNTTFTGKIIVVNAYKAILSRLHNNSAECTESNLPELLFELESLGSSRLEIEKGNFKTKISSYIDTAIAVVRHHISECQMNEKEIWAERERIENEFLNSTKEIEAIVEDLLSFISLESRNANNFAAELSRTSAEGLRADIRMLIDSGIVDGNQLTEAFNDYQEIYLLDSIEQQYDYMTAMTYELSKKLAVLSDQIKVERASSFEGANFDNGQAFKFEKVFKVAFNIAGALGGPWAGAKVGVAVGAKVGAALGAAAGPVGVIMGFIAGTGSAIIAGSIGTKVQLEIISMRGSQAKREIEPYILEFEKKIYLSVFSNTNNIMNNINDLLQKYLEDRISYYSEMYSKGSGKDVEHLDTFNISELNDHLAYLENRKEALK